jgi:hypothetical protein
LQKHKTKDGFALGSWVFNQRTNKDLQQERRKQLDDLGFVWDPYEKQWSENIQALINYKNEFGDCEVPQKYIYKDGFALGVWVGHQRRSKNLSAEKKRQLDDLGFAWKVKKGRSID